MDERAMAVSVITLTEQRNSVSVSISVSIFQIFGRSLTSSTVAAGMMPARYSACISIAPSFKESSTIAES